MVAKIDSIFHAYDMGKKQFMEYLEFHGTYADIPVDVILTAWEETYGKDRVRKWIDNLEKDRNAVQNSDSG